MVAKEGKCLETECSFQFSRLTHRAIVYPNQARETIVLSPASFISPMIKKRLLDLVLLHEALNHHCSEVGNNLTNSDSSSTMSSDNASTKSDPLHSSPSKSSIELAEQQQQEQL